MIEQIEQQKRFFELLSNTLKQSVYVWDGVGHKAFFGRNKRHFRVSQLHNAGFLVNDILRFNGRQLTFDFDNDDWNINKTNAQLLKNYLDKNNIPYLIIITGGRGLRFQIYLDTNLPLLQDHIFYLYAYICNNCFLNWENFGVPENKQKNHLLGTIGKKGKLGFYATYSETIPDKRPETKLSEIKFPSEIKLWKLDKSFVSNALAFGNSLSKEEIKTTFQRFRYKKSVMLKW